MVNFEYPPAVVIVTQGVTVDPHGMNKIIEEMFFQFESDVNSINVDNKDNKFERAKRQLIFTLSPKSQTLIEKGNKVWANSILKG